MKTYNRIWDLIAWMKFEYDNLKIPFPQVFSKRLFRTWLLLRFFLPRTWLAGLLMESEPQRNVNTGKMNSWVEQPQKM